MSTRNKSKSDDLDKLEEDAREVPADRTTSTRGPKVLHERLRQAAQRKKQVTIRLDADIIERFKQLAGPDGSYQTLMNRALHE
ncbi:MAG: BrnA antitoxin family protein [Bradymonadaceae bacterium]